VDGRLLSWRVRPGDRVAAGDALAELTAPELAELSAELASAAAARREAQEAVTLASASRDRGVGRAAEVRQAEAALSHARAAESAARRRLVAHRDTVTAEGDAWVWRSPVDGVVDEISCALGMVAADRECLTLLALDDVVVVVDVPERYLAALEAPVTLTMVGGDGRSWEASELGRAATVQPRTRARAFRFALTSDLEVLPGMSGRAQLRVPVVEDVHQVAAAALTRIEGQPTVFVRGTGDAPEARAVTVHGRDAGLVVVEGLADGEEVAVRGVFLLKSLAAMREEA